MVFDFELVKPTYIENWPRMLANHSVATVHFPLTREQSEALLKHNFMMLEDNDEAYLPTEADKVHLQAIVDAVDRYVGHFPRGIFIRLGSRSPKDSWIGCREGFRCETGKRAVDLLCDSERIYEDLLLARANGYTNHIVVREWIDIQPWQEFRCFYKNRKLAGISQYNYLQNAVYPEIEEFAGAIEWAIRLKSEEVATLLPADNVVVDFAYKVWQRGNERVSKAILLECNPFFTYTDPCLFDWSRDTFDRFEFRYLK